MAIKIAATSILEGKEADYFIKNMEKAEKQVARRVLRPNPNIDKILKEAFENIDNKNKNSV